MNTYFCYVRVSSTRQGEFGVSLQQQKAAIQDYSRRHELPISRWFEEQETAAKQGRPVFSQMIRLLKQHKAAGVIMHKIDRSARNLKDWAELGELIDSGLIVHFANEPLDLHSRGGRLSADIQAVIASDFIRNLREETKKGFYGRLKQGLFPMPAPVGYLNQGKGKPKLTDPGKAPLVRQCFELYATGRYTVVSLMAEMHRRGLRGRKGQRITWHGMSKILNNSFYTGLVRIKKTGESFVGIHEPIVSRALFDRVQAILHGKVQRSIVRHDYLFRQTFSCRSCRRTLVGEQQKGTVYYRCHTRGCRGRCIRQDQLEQVVIREIKKLEFSQEEKDYFRTRLISMRQDWETEQGRAVKTLQLRLAQLKDRELRLTDAFLEQLLDQSTFQERKTALLAERCELETRLKQLSDDPTRVYDELNSVLELAGSAYLAYRAGVPEEKRELLKLLSSNRAITTEQLVFTLTIPFSAVANRFEYSHGSPRRETVRVWNTLLSKLLIQCSETL